MSSESKSKEEALQLLRSSSDDLSREFEHKIEELSECAVSIVVIGASGHLARTKTFPALFGLHKAGFLTDSTSIIGFARSQLEHGEFLKRISAKFAKEDKDVVASFLARCTYVSGQYGSTSSFVSLDQHLRGLESKARCAKDGKCVQPGRTGGVVAANRLFYFAIPPSQFAATAASLKSACLTSTGWNRVVVEKPFGRDTETSRTLSKQLLQHFDESQIYRIDHYLGKEMVQNLQTLRFANSVFEPILNRVHVKAVKITFKETDGVEGRGGYFDPFGIIRDVMQNHLLQILSLVAMECPVSLAPRHIHAEKIKVLEAIEPLDPKHLAIGQYKADEEGKLPGYLDDETVPEDSITPTCASAVLFIKNTRWDGVPFLLKCGKALNARKAEVRIQFKHVPGRLFTSAPCNELVVRVQPDEAIYLKLNTKQPGLNQELHQSELDLSYHSRFNLDEPLPSAYERLILDVLRGNNALFVTEEELEASWAILTPVLHKLEKEKVKPELYPRGSQDTKGGAALFSKYFERNAKYSWSKSNTRSKM